MPLHKELENYYHAPISHMVDGFRREDPPSEKKLAVEVEVPEHCCKEGLKSGTAKGLAIGDLIIIAFFLLLRIGEYTVKTTKKHTKRTVQYHMIDVVFFKKDKYGQLCQLPHNSSRQRDYESRWCYTLVV